MKMKRFFILSILFAVTLLMHASGDAITLTFSDGTSSTLLLSDKPSITFVGGQVTISTINSTTTIERSMLKGFSRVGDENAVSHLSENGIKLDGKDRFFISGRASVSVASIDGKQIEGSIIANGDETEVNLSRLPDGIYIISVNKGQTIKYQKR